MQLRNSSLSNILLSVETALELWNIERDSSESLFYAQRYIENKNIEIMSKKVMLLEQFIEEGLFDVVTKSKAFVKNPIAATKITNNGKKLVQSEIDKAANDLDYEKRKLASKKAADSKMETLKKKGDAQGAQKVKDEFADNKEVLSAAHDQKNDALKDKVESIKDRIDDLSKKNATLQDLGSLVKTAARVKRNEVLLKGADEEEKKQLKVQMQGDMEKIDNLQKGFGDYESGKSEEEPRDKSQSEKPQGGKTPPPPPPPVPRSEPAAEPAAEPAEEPELTTPSEPKADAEPQDPASKLGQARADLSDAQRNRADIRNRLKDYDDRIANLKAGKYDRKKIADPKAEIESLEQQKKKAEERLVDADEDVKMTVAAAEKAEKELNASKEKEASKEEPAAEPAEEPELTTPSEPKADAEPQDPKAALDAEVEKNLTDRGKLTRQIKDLEKELEWKSGEEETAVKDKIESLKAERKKIDDEGEKLAKRMKELEGDPWKGSAKESFTTLKSFKDFVNEKKFS
jgi:chromosome segregation ATPase